MIHEDPVHSIFSAMKNANFVFTSKQPNLETVPSIKCIRVDSISWSNHHHPVSSLRQSTWQRPHHICQSSCLGPRRDLNHARWPAIVSQVLRQERRLRDNWFSFRQDAPRWQRRRASSAFRCLRTGSCLVHRACIRAWPPSRPPWGWSSAASMLRSGRCCERASHSLLRPTVAPWTSPVAFQHVWTSHEASSHSWTCAWSLS
mmetsp:Transcript_8758/g.53840  ORF Transcript_8758/g.53840 Transcript_8758/m.53840 type:complete len:202 (-) Transcript_8758:42-647(-)